MNPNPPSNPGVPGQDPSDPHQQTQLRPTWQTGENPQQQAGAPSYPQYQAQPPYSGPAQPAYGAPGQVPPAQFGGVPPQLPGAPRKPRPGWLIPALIGGAAVLLVIVLIAGIVIVKSVGGGSDDTGSPGATVKSYFAALQAGDAKKALSFGKEAPATSDLLTDEILRKQRDLAPIKDLKIVSETGGYMGRVHLTVSIGEVAYDEEIMLEQVGDTWKLKTAAVQIKPSFVYDADKTNLTILGKALPASGVVYVFPGALDLGSQSKNLTVTQRATSGNNTGQATVKGLSGYGGYLSVQFGLSDAATSEARTQIAAKYAACAASKDRAPTGCPQSDFTGADGSYTWTAPSAQEITFDDTVRSGEVSFTDRRPWTFTATSRDGQPVTGSDTVFVYGKVTVTPDAVAVSLR